jgi:hypothetical protein
MLRVVKKYFSKFDDMLKKLNIKLPDNKPIKHVKVNFKEFNTLDEYFIYFKANRELLKDTPDQYFLFLENLSSAVYKTNETCESLDEIVNLYSGKLGKLESIYFVSFIESLERFEYFDNKIWIVIESIILKSSIIKEIDMRYYYIILKGFQQFYHKETTISAEDVFEIIEYNTINKLKGLKEIVISTKDDLKLLDLYILLGLNLEGSNELYTLIINKLLLPNLTIISKLEEKDLINLYTASSLISKTITTKINPFIMELTKILNHRDISGLKPPENDFLQWGIKINKTI